jgi:hypothetical protein
LPEENKNGDIHIANALIVQIDSWAHRNKAAISPEISFTDFTDYSSNKNQNSLICNHL